MPDQCCCLSGLILVAIPVAGEVFGLGSAGVGAKQLLLAASGVLLTGWGLVWVLPISQASVVRTSVAVWPLRSIHVVGGLYTAGLVLYTVLAWGMVTLVPTNQRGSTGTGVFCESGPTVGFCWPWCVIFFGRAQFLGPARSVVGCLLSTCFFLSCLWLFILLLLANRQSSLHPGVPKAIFRWTAVFAAILVVAPPVLVQDFWASVAIGRLVQAGQNPYYVPLTAELVSGMPLDYLKENFVYGPFMAVFSTVITFLVRDDGILAGFIFKLLLAGAWLGTVRLVWVLLRYHSIWRQSVALIVAGWMPLSIMQSVGDGHNDILMIFFIVLWLYTLKRSTSVVSSLALAASVMVKYVSAPLFVLDLLYHRVSRRQSWSAYVPRAVAALLFISVLLALFYRSPEFFSAVRVTQNWHFYRPVDALSALELLTGVGLGFLRLAVRVFFLTLALWSTVRYVQRPSQERFWAAVTAFMAAILFALSAHLWPWYVLWVLVPSALVPGTRLARWAIGLALVAPFLLLPWTILPTLDSILIFELPALLFYLFALLWLMLMPRYWLPPADSNGSSGQEAAPAGARQ